MRLNSVFGPVNASVHVDVVEVAIDFSTNGGATAAGRQRRAWYFSRIGPNFFQSSV
jgi:hypothetical protein